MQQLSPWLSARKGVWALLLVKHYKRREHRALRGTRRFTSVCSVFNANRYHFNTGICLRSQHYSLKSTLASPDHRNLSKEGSVLCAPSARAMAHAGRAVWRTAFLPRHFAAAKHFAFFRVSTVAWIPSGEANTFSDPFGNQLRWHSGLLFLIKPLYVLVQI